MDLGITTRRRSMTALIVTVALMNTATVLASTAGTLIAADTSGPQVSGLPSAAGILGTAAGSLLSGTLTARRGRRFALLTGYGAATAGGLVACVGAIGGSLVLLLAGLVVLGLGNGAAQLSRYLAADMYPQERKGFALSSVVWAGTIGALAGPLMIAPVAHAAEHVGLPGLSGPILAACAAVACAAATAFALPPDEVPEVTVHEGWAVFRRRSLRLPLGAMVAAQITMVAVMTMTPPQLHHLGHGLEVVGWILAAHIFGMFALSPLTGRLADRIGGRRTIGIGIVVLALSAVLAYALPTSHESGLPVSLFLLGYGWNLMFVGGSSLLSSTVQTRAKGAVDAVIWGSSAFASIGSGHLFGYGGYPLVAAVAGVLAVLPVFLLVTRASRTTE
nr:MFS transporter [Kibdelosporangium sp. MJ126-NF4]CEL22458.1 major facilitator superfamily MFS_1 [Kibdelosporangium sp. MJ126-NF4]CTQ89314.1 major facilitator superfamily MFS_1 [Kibdelosporangium sp. MJ126-NF4]